MRELKVDPAEVHRSGVEVGEIAAAVTSAFTNSDTEIASAGPGWMGKSAAALASMAAEWHAVWIILPKSSSSTEATSPWQQGGTVTSTSPGRIRCAMRPRTFERADKRWVCR